MKKWLKNLFGDLLDFLVSKVVPVAIALGVLSLLIFLKDYDLRIDKWLNGDWDRYGLIFLGVIPSAILLYDVYNDHEDTPNWLWLSSYLAIGVMAWLVKPQAAMASALSVYANVFFLMYSLYFLLFVGINKFPRKIKDIAKWVLGIGSALLLVVPIIIGYVLAKDGKLVPHNFEVSGLPLAVIVGGVMILIAILADKVIPSGSSSKSSVSRGVKYQGSGKPTYEQVYKAAYSAARDSYFTLVDIRGGNGGNFTVVLKYNHSDANSKQAYFQRFKSLFVSSFSGYDLSGISIQA